jgi:hypothetical protein
MKITPIRIAASGVAVAVASLAIAAPSFAEGDTPRLEDAATTVDDGDVVVDDTEPIDCDIVFEEFEGVIEDFEGDLEDIEDWEPTAEEVAEINAETDDLVAHLAANGVTVEVETDDLGLRYPVLEDIEDEATWDLIDQFFDDRYGDLIFEDFEGDLEDIEDWELELLDELEGCAFSPGDGEDE